LTDQAQLLPRTLDLLILRAVSLGPLHGYGILLRIGQISGNALLIEQGALYPGLFRLVRQGLLKATWGTSENMATIALGVMGLMGAMLALASSAWRHTPSASDCASWAFESPWAGSAKRFCMPR
jgi:hypothetical protein